MALAASSQAALLDAALKGVLACPRCHGQLAKDSTARGLRCLGCQAGTVLVDGIPVFTGDQRGLQVEEKAFRDRAASQVQGRGAVDLLNIVSRHHCVPLMGGYARKFRGRFSAWEWLLDIGTGYAWHWKDAPVSGARVIGIDMSLGNLLLARRLFGESSRCALLICADASRLPLAKGSIAGVWSVQAFQHFPEETFQQAQQELDRVLQKDFRMEFHHLNPALCYRLLYRLQGRRMPLKGRSGPFVTNRLSASEWEGRWNSFRGGQFDMFHGYSELFFHPELWIRPRPYPLGFERFLTRYALRVSSSFARQVILRLETRASRKNSS